MRLSARIVSYRISNGALSAKDLPRRLKVLDWGENASLKGPVRVGTLTVEQLPLVQPRKGWDRIALDYEHNTLPGTPEFERSKEPRAVAAFGVAVVVEGDGLYLDDLQWTPHGEQFAREYVDLSPTPLQTADGTVIGLHSVALCRHGAVDGLQFYSVNLEDKESVMDWKAFICDLLGLPAETSDADVKKAFDAYLNDYSVKAVALGLAPLAATIEGLKTQLAALTAAVPEKAGETIAALSADVTALKGETAAYRTEILKRDRSDVLAAAARDGKVVGLSAESVEKLSVEDLRAHVAGLPVTVPIEQRTPAHVQAHSADAAAQQDGAVLDRVARACGIDPKSVK